MNTYIFLEETTRDKTQKNFLNIELNQDSVKPQDNSSSLQCTYSSLSSEIDWVKCVQMKEAHHLFIFIKWVTQLPN